MTLVSCCCDVLARRAAEGTWGDVAGTSVASGQRRHALARCYRVGLLMGDRAKLMDGDAVTAWVPQPYMAVQCKGATLVASRPWIAPTVCSTELSGQ